jgi:hypothetical protein
MKTKPISRRALAAGLALAPVAGFPALAGAPILSDALAQAIDRHKAARDASDAYHGGDDGTVDRLADADFAARAVLAALPVSTTEELFAKLRYLIQVEKIAWGGWMIDGNFDLDDKFGAICFAIDLHLNAEA